MYNKKAWGGPTEPFILTKFLPVEGDADPIVSFVVFEYKDDDLVGIPIEGTYDKHYICNDKTIEMGYCNKTDAGQFILAANATEKSNNLILTQAVHLKDAKPINYPIKKTGYYCVGVIPYEGGDNFAAAVEFREAYGELPATQIPKLPFYGGITVLYAVVVVFWGFLYYQHRYDICRFKAPINCKLRRKLTSFQCLYRTTSRPFLCSLLWRCS